LNIKDKNKNSLFDNLSDKQEDEYKYIFKEKIGLLFKEISKQIIFTEQQENRKKNNENFNRLMKLLNTNTPDESISNSMKKAKRLQELYSQIDEIQKEIDKLSNET